jgi:hypothetical protein
LDFWITAFGDFDYALFFETLPCILECFFVDCFEIGQITLMIERFAKLSEGQQMIIL